MPLRTDRAPLNLRVNGKRHQLVVKPWHTLLEMLRDDLGLTGTKRGCEDGTCGTCTVTVTGAVARACRVPLGRAEGSEVVTIEGLANRGQLHPLQEAFIAADAVQCGFCSQPPLLA